MANNKLQSPGDKLPDYSTSENGKVLAVSSGDLAWAANAAATGSTGPTGPTGATDDIVAGATLGDLATGAAGELKFVSDANGGTGAIAFYNGTAWVDISTGAAPV